MDSLENKDLHAPETVQAEENAVNETTEVQEVSQVVDEIEVSGVEPAEDIANEEQEETTAAETEEAPEDKPLTKEGIVEQFKVLLSGQVSEIKEQADLLKTQFYRIFRQEQEAARKQWEELGEKAEDYKPVIDEIEQQFRHLLEIYRQQRQEEREKREAEMQQNQLRKENIIAQMKQMAESDTADVTENLKKMRELRGEWKSIGAVPPTVATLLWKEYNLYQEKFYDLVKINNELREYDFRKNLEQKTAICEQAEALKDKGDV